MFANGGGGGQIPFASVGNPKASRLHATQAIYSRVSMKKPFRIP